MNKLTNQQVLKLLPHRYPFLMIDRVEDFSHTKLVALKNFTVNEPYAQGHFPQVHIMPGVMMVEAMAQASALLGMVYIKNTDKNTVAKYFSKGFGFLFVAADQIRFKKVVYPGDTLKIHVTIKKAARQLFEFECVIMVEDQIVACGTLKAVGGIDTAQEAGVDVVISEADYKFIELPKQELETE